MNNDKSLQSDITNVLQSSHNFDFFKVGIQLITKHCVMGTHIEKSYDSETGLPTCKFLVDFIGVSADTGNTVNKKIPFFIFISQSREEDITEEILTLLMYCLIEAMNAESAETDGVVFNFDNVANKIKHIFPETLTYIKEHDALAIDKNAQNKETEEKDSE